MAEKVIFLCNSACGGVERLTTYAYNAKIQKNFGICEKDCYMKHFYICGALLKSVRAIVYRKREAKAEPGLSLF